MARVVRRTSRGRQYLQVVEDYKKGDTWKQKVLRSFGSGDDPNNLAEAIHYAGEVNAYKEAMAEHADEFDDPTFLERPWVKVLGAGALTFLGGVLGYKAARRIWRDDDAPEHASEDDGEE